MVHHLRQRLPWRHQGRIGLLRVLGLAADYSTSGSYVDTAVGGYFTVKSGLDGALGKAHSVVKYHKHGKKHGHWKNVKRLELNGHGKAHWTRSIKKKFRYRIAVPSSWTVQGRHSYPTSKFRAAGRRSRSTAPPPAPGAGPLFYGP